MARSAKDERRDKILESTWKLVARDGIGATNMRALAAEAGYANGALAYYFSGKDELLRAAFEYVLRQTMSRIALKTRGLRGIAALRAFCVEILPEDELKLLEARVVLPFWSSALNDVGFAAINERAMASWRNQMQRYLSQAVALREIPRPSRPRQHVEAIEALLSMLHGAQVLAVLTPARHPPRVTRANLDAFLLQLSMPARATVAKRPRARRSTGG